MNWLAPFALGLLALVSGCYTVVVPSPNARSAPLERPLEVQVDAHSARLAIAYRDGAAGIANRYELEIGDAFARYVGVLLRGAPGSGEEPLVVRARLEEASVRDFAVHLTAIFDVELPGAPFRGRYVVEGPSYFVPQSEDVDRRAVVVALQRSAHDALVLAVREFAGDLRARLAEP